jgi:hypothetical protein
MLTNRETFDLDFSHSFEKWPSLLKRVSKFTTKVSLEAIID